jgi:putative acetyltransferase
MFDITEDDLSGDATRSFLALHLAGMHANPVFALDLSGLQVPEVTVWTVWRDGKIASVGAVKELGNGIGELRSMRTHPDYLRQGAATALLDHIIAEARARGLKRLSLETGSGPAFKPVLTLYRKRGFVDGEAFSNYKPSPFYSSGIYRCDRRNPHRNSRKSVWPKVHFR